MRLSQELDALVVSVNNESLEMLIESAQPREQRVRQIREFYAAADKQLRVLLSRLHVEVELMEALGGWTVRGPVAEIERLQRHDSPLRRTDFRIEADDTFTAMSDGG